MEFLEGLVLTGGWRIWIYWLAMIPLGRLEVLIGSGYVSVGGLVWVASFIWHAGFTLFWNS